jgi:uncharacterized protein (DUF924 family)
VNGPEAIAPADVLAFWTEAGPDKWFGYDAGFDAEIRDRFGRAVEAARRGAYDDWAETAEGALALLILLDQFPRNLFRGSAEAYASDEKARAVACQAIARGFDEAYRPPLQRFFYMPFMHAESLVDQELCLALTQASGDDDGAHWARVHRDVIARFGRFPHRNPVLGRATTPEEAAFLEEPHSSF